MNCLKCEESIDSVCPSFDKDSDLKYVVKFLSYRFSINFCSITFVEKEGYYSLHIVSDRKLKQSKNYKRINRTIDDIVVKGWEVILQSNPDCEFYDEFIAERNFNVEHFHRSDSVHRGHLLASQLKGYLVPNGKCDAKNVNDFFGKGCVENISNQTNKANCDSEKHHGQLFFEREILGFLEKDEGNKVYYNIYDISVNERSLGRVMNYYNDCSSSFELFGLVFVPNVK